MPTRAPSRVTDRGCPRVTFSGQREGPFIGKKKKYSYNPSSAAAASAGSWDAADLPEPLMGRLPLRVMVERWWFN